MQSNAMGSRHQQLTPEAGARVGSQDNKKDKETEQKQKENQIPCRIKAKREESAGERMITGE